jgi:hypothetical protein
MSVREVRVPVYEPSAAKLEAELCKMPPEKRHEPEGDVWTLSR